MAENMIMIILVNNDSRSLLFLSDFGYVTNYLNTKKQII